MNPLDDFLTFKKEAGWLSTLGDAAKAVGGALKSFGGATAGVLEKAAPYAAGSLMVGAGMSGGALATSAIRERFGKQRDFKAMMEANPNLEKMDAGNVQLTYNSLRKAAPSLASDPLMAGSFVRRTLEMSDPPYVDAQTIKTLTDSQKNISQVRGGQHPFRDIAMGIASRPMPTEREEKPDFPIEVGPQGMKRRFQEDQMPAAEQFYQQVQQPVGRIRMRGGGGARRKR